MTNDEQTIERLEAKMLGVQVEELEKAKEDDDEVDVEALLQKRFSSNSGSHSD